MANKQTVEVSLKYKGPDVDDGTMLVEDIVPALQGFSSAYSKIVSYKQLPYQHRIRITALSKGSFDVALQVWETAVNNADQLQTIAVVTGGAVGIIKIIFGVIDLIKHTKNQPSHTKIKENNVLIVVNSDGVEKEFPLDVFSIFSEKIIGLELEKIITPLDTGRINTLDCSAILDNKTIHTDISDIEKPYFINETTDITQTQEATLDGEFVSIHFHTNRGKFALPNGRQISYQLPAENPSRFYPFLIQTGRLMKIKCIGHLDSNFEVSRVDILDVVPLQQSIIDSNS